MSDTLAEKKIAALPALNEDSFPMWLWQLQSALRTGRVWNDIFALDPTTGLPPACPPSSDIPEYMAYTEKARKACRWIDNTIGYEHRALTEKFKDKGDAYGMLDAITIKYAEKTPVNRHQALVRLLNVRKKSGESCSEFILRIKILQHHFRLLRPTNYSLDDLNDEICTQRLLVSLDHSSQYYSTVLSLTPLDFDTVANSMNERDENHAGSVPFANQTSISSANAASDNANPANGDDICHLCDRRNHSVINCPRLGEARDLLRSRDLVEMTFPTNNSYQNSSGWNNRGWRSENNSNYRGGGRGNGRGGGRRGNHACRNSGGSWNSNGSDQKTGYNALEFEYAGIASTLLSPGATPSDLWTVDSGASSSMTPRRD